MDKIKDFYQLDAWKESHKLNLLVYKITNAFPKDEKYCLTDQIRRAVSSITANIAEGFGRFHFTDKIRFYHQARGSIKEVQNFIILAKDLGYFNVEEAKKIWKKSKDAEKLINGLIRSAEKQKVTGY